MELEGNLMTTKPSKATALLDLGPIAAMIAFIAVLINKASIAAPLDTALLLILALAATAIGLKREAQKEARLDEVELAGANFGARWSIAVVTVAALLMLFIAPLQNAITQLSMLMETSNGVSMPVPGKVFVLGMVSAIAIQLTAKSTLAAIWKWTKR
jgi:hypothetical protein